ncbi:MAG: single-stranded DNA-binding protein [Oscillospiraceae bacterium]|nr:single-stranded DNA-binding protein [Oscillospiraceae bacterium]
MDELIRNNHVLLRGTPCGEPLWSHAARAQDFYTLPLEVRRLSGAADTLNLTLRASALTGLSPGIPLEVEGELRSFNSRRDDWPRLVISVFVRSVRPTHEEDENLVELRGTLCKTPKLRRTPLGRDICDLLLAVNRSYGRSDYLPCICWGLTAREAALQEVGAKLALRGRIQSRRYLKQTALGEEERVAFEVSAAEIEFL